MYSSRHNRQSRQHGGPGPAFIRPGYPRRRLSGAAPIQVRPYLTASAKAREAASAAHDVWYAGEEARAFANGLL